MNKSCAQQFTIDEADKRYYETIQISEPTRCPDCRHRTRFNLRNPRKLYNRNCAKCAASIITTFSPRIFCDAKNSTVPAVPETVYCEKCFQDSMD